MYSKKVSVNLSVSNISFENGLLDCNEIIFGVQSLKSFIPIFPVGGSITHLPLFAR